LPYPGSVLSGWGSAAGTRKANLKTAWIVAGRAWVADHRLTPFVIRVQAGIRKRCHRIDPDHQPVWIPACAELTGERGRWADIQPRTGSIIPLFDLDPAPRPR